MERRPTWLVSATPSKSLQGNKTRVEARGVAGRVQTILIAERISVLSNQMIVDPSGLRRSCSSSQMQDGGRGGPKMTVSFINNTA